MCKPQLNNIKTICKPGKIKTYNFTFKGFKTSVETMRKLIQQYPMIHYNFRLL